MTFKILKYVEQYFYLMIAFKTAKKTSAQTKCLKNQIDTILKNIVLNQQLHSMILRYLF